MAITLKFFMIKRGLTIDKMAQKSGSSTPEGLIDYAKSLNIGVTETDEKLVREYFAKLNDVSEKEVQVQEKTVIELPAPTAPVLETKKRGKKRAGKNV